jgi:hypothetical protein
MRVRRRILATIAPIAGLASIPDERPVQPLAALLSVLD